MRIAFAGNPNSGKTTMYNALTGRNEKVGNWAGVTVDRKEAPIKKVFAGQLELIAIDLPGAYSMSPFTMTLKFCRSSRVSPVVSKWLFTTITSSPLMSRVKAPEMLPAET